MKPSILALLLIVSMFSSASARADNRFQSIFRGLIGLCEDDGKSINHAWEERTRTQLVGRTFVFNRIIFENTLYGGYQSSITTLKDMQSYTPPSQTFSDGEHLVYPYKINFRDSESAILNDEFIVEWRLEGCYGGTLYLYNSAENGRLNTVARGLPNNGFSNISSRFFGSLELTEDGFSLCDYGRFCASGPLPMGKDRSTSYFLEVFP